MPAYAYFKKKFVPLADARVSIMTHSLHYGTAVFEGIRGNWNKEQGQMYIFRLPEHYRRLLNGCKLLKINLPHTVNELCDVTVELIRKCGNKEDMYIRPVAYKSSEALGLRLHGLEDDIFILTIPWGRYIDVDKARCGVSSWRRPDDNAIPPSGKICGIYVNNSLAKTEAIENGYDEAIMLTPDGHVSECSGENIFLVADGKLVTTRLSDSILPGITRDTVIKLAKNELKLETIERPIDRSELYTADECFMTGTAAHITPVSEVDHRTIGNGEIGRITKKLQKVYFDVIKGNNPMYLDWCTPVYLRKKK